VSGALSGTTPPRCAQRGKSDAIGGGSVRYGGAATEHQVLLVAPPSTETWRRALATTERRLRQPWMSNLATAGGQVDFVVTGTERRLIG
jgi:hypothetical protein